MKRLVVVWLMVAACAAEDPETADTTQAGTSSQGTSSQGTSSQGTSSQGTSSQGTSSQGTTSGGATASGAHVVGTALEYWQPASYGMWTLVTPTHTCLYDQYRSIEFSCTANVNLATQTSPLAGSKWPTTFVQVTGPGSYTAQAVTLQIGTQVGAVSHDSSTAMFDLKGANTSSPLVSCLDPAGCRSNSDLFLYDVNVIDSTGAVTSLCPAGEHAMALQGVWDATGTYTPSTQFTFACTSGTIVKCARWGYRPWASAIPDDAGSGATPTPLAEYHQACVHAAMADYCGNGHSFTKTGTVIDVSDIDGFIKSTADLLHGGHDTATAFEGWFDSAGGRGIEQLRYEELNNPANPNYDLKTWCPNKFQLTDGFPVTYIRPPVGRALISIDSSPACAHSELQVGKWLHPTCSACTGNAAIPKYCTDPTDPRGWDATCVTAATQACTNTSTRMAPTHNECTTGVGLNQYDSGCTLKMSLKGYASCFYTWDWGAWSSGCVSAANQICTGGEEHWTIHGSVGFCGQSIPLLNGT